MGVTLVSEDNKELKCHKVVHGAGSPIFRSILLRNPHQHPLLYISGVQHRELQSLLTFMYLGQTEVAQQDLNSFMAVASKFKIQGLSTEENRGLKNESFKTGAEYEENETFANLVQDPDHRSLANIYETSDHVDTFSNSEDVNWTSNPEQIDRIGDEFKCEKCEYKSKYKHNVRLHMKAQHEVVKYSCNYCDFKTGYSSNLAKHRQKKHTN